MKFEFIEHTSRRNVQVQVNLSEDKTNSNETRQCVPPWWLYSENKRCNLSVVPNDVHQVSAGFRGE